jgi:PAS domain S-box-containing protein
VKANLQDTGESDRRKSVSSDSDISDQIINHSRSMISIINRNYIYEKVNATYCREHQIVSESVEGKSLSDVWGNDTFRDHIKGKVDLCLSGETVSYVASFHTPRQGTRFYEVVFRPLASANEGITHLMAETFDINDLRVSRQQADEMKEQLRQFETNLPIGFLRCKPDGRILHANKAFRAIVDYPEEIQVVGMNLKSFYPVEVLYDIQVEQLLELRTKTFGRVFLKNRKGNEILCRISGFLATDESEKPSFIDLAIEDSSRELMLENRLLQAQKLETIGALAGGIAHDFNNILTTISGYSEMLRDDLPNDSPESDKVTRIQGAVKKAQSIINQILTFSRHVEQEKIPVNVSEILAETIGFVRSSVPRNIYVVSRIQEKNTDILADPTQLFRVFLNLMTNAIQSMEAAGGTLSVSLEVVDGKSVKNELNRDIVADEYALLGFKDTGKGMEPSVLERIFEPFFTTREVGKGIGLGLSVIHGIITELEGEILVSSRREKGTTFYVYLPVSKEYEDTPRNDKKRKKILFITGNKYESRILSIALEKSGYDLRYITDRRNLLNLLTLSDDRPDLIIYMSESKQVQPEDVISAFSQLKIEIPCMLISDSIPALIEENLLNSGIIKQQLIKPVSLKEIRSAIKELLG